MSILCLVVCRDAAVAKDSHGFAGGLGSAVLRQYSLVAHVERRYNRTGTGTSPHFGLPCIGACNTRQCPGISTPAVGGLHRSVVACIMDAEVVRMSKKKNAPKTKRGFL